MVSIDTELYKSHPRILEIRLIILYDMFEKEFGVARTKDIFKQFMKMFKCQEEPILAVLNKRYDIKRGSTSTKKQLWRQEVIFMSYCYGETAYKVAKEFLHMAPSSIYNNRELYNPECFITEDWLVKLDKDTNSSFSKFSRLEVARLLDGIDSLLRVLDTWKGGK